MQPYVNISQGPTATHHHRCIGAVGMCGPWRAHELGVHGPWWFTAHMLHDCVLDGRIGDTVSHGQPMNDSMYTVHSNTHDMITVHMTSPLGNQSAVNGNVSTCKLFQVMRLCSTAANAVVAGQRTLDAG